MITIGIIPENERETAGGTISGILICNRLTLNSFGKNSPTRQATIMATNKPCAPKYWVEMALTPSTEKEVGYKIINAATLVKPTSVASAQSVLLAVGQPDKQ